MSRWDVTSMCRNGRWARLARGSYLVDSDVVGAPSRRAHIRAAAASYGRHAVVGLHTAAELHGIGGAPPTQAVHLLLPGTEGRPRRVLDTSIRPHQMSLQPMETTTVDGIAVTTPLRTMIDLVLALDRVTAVSVVDSCLNRGLVSDDEVTAAAAMLAHRRGAVAARKHLSEADGRAESPLETRVRLECVDGGVAPDELQYVVRDGHGRDLARCDFAWTKHRLIGEADGAAVHSLPEALYRDRQRQNDLVNAGFTVLRFTDEDARKLGEIVRLVRAAQARALQNRQDR
jgi:very-short-patch-repair endonuclease